MSLLRNLSNAKRFHTQADGTDNRGIATDPLLEKPYSLYLNNKLRILCFIEITVALNKSINNIATRIRNL